MRKFLISTAALMLMSAGAIAGPISDTAQVQGFDGDVSLGGLTKCLDNYDGMSATRRGSAIVWRGNGSHTIISLAGDGETARITAISTTLDGLKMRGKVSDFISATDTFCYNPVDTRSLGEKLSGKPRYQFETWR